MSQQISLFSALEPFCITEKGLIVIELRVRICDIKAIEVNVKQNVDQLPASIICKI